MSPTSPKPRRPRGKRTLLIAGAVGLLAVVSVGLWMGRSRAPEAPYRTAAVEKGSVVKSVSASGALEALVTVEVGSQISGQIREVRVDFNDEVKKGQVLAVLDPQTYESRLAQGRADIAAGQAGLAQAQANLAAAQADVGRKRTLVAKGIYAPSTLDTSEAAYKSAVAAVQSARAKIAQSTAALGSTRIDLSRTVIVSPIDGVVVDRQIEPGQTVAASLQAPVLFRIAQDLSKVQVKISVDEADIGQVREGQATRFTVDAFPDDNYQGIVTQVRKQPVTESNVVAYTVIAEADNPQGRLLPGMTANADIVIEQHRDVLKVPAAALRWKPPSQNAQSVSGPPGFGGPPGGRPPGAGSGNGGGGRSAMGQRLVEDLDLNADQRRQWTAIQADMRQKMASALASGDRAAMRAAMRKNMQEALSQLEPSLSAEQKTKLAVVRATLAEQQSGGDRNFTGGVVYVLRKDEPTPVPVRVGVTDGAFTEIRGPLKSGDLVITGGGPKAKIKARAPFGGGSSQGGAARSRN